MVGEESMEEGIEGGGGGDRLGSVADRFEARSRLEGWMVRDGGWRWGWRWGWGWR